MSAEIIRSKANPILKRVSAILAGREPETLVLEGDRLVDDALGARLAIELVLVAEERPERALDLSRYKVPVKLVETALLQRISALKTSPGILALCPAPRAIAIADIALDPRALLLVAAGVADPGNLGALARSAEAFGVRALIVASGSASPWNEKALRGSMGSLLRVPVCSGVDGDRIAMELRSRGVRQVCAATRGGADPARFDWSGALALWVGGETGSLPRAAREFESVTIPMAGGVESLNLTVAASLLLSAAGRVAHAKSVAKVDAKKRATPRG